MMKVTLLMAEDAHRKLKANAALEGKTVSDVVRELVNEYNKKLEKKS